MSKTFCNEKNISNEMFMDLFVFYHSSFLAKDLYEVNKAKNKKLLNQVNEELIN